MAGSVNKVIIIGNVGKAVEIRTTQNGGRIGQLTVATSETWKDKVTGERKETTQWHRICLFSEQLVDFAERFVNKGAKVYVEGTLETRKWSNSEGVDQYVTEVVLRPYSGALTLLSAIVKDEDETPAPRRSAPTKPQADPEPMGYDFEDEVPF